MISLNATGKLTFAILGGVVGGQMISKSMDDIGLYDIYNPLWNIAIGLVILIGISKLVK